MIEWPGSRVFNIEQLAINVHSLFPTDDEAARELITDHFPAPDVETVVVALRPIRLHLKHVLWERLDEICLELEGGQVAHAIDTDNFITDLQAAFSAAPKRNMILTINRYFSKAAPHIPEDRLAKAPTLFTSLFVSSLLEVLHPKYRPHKRRLDSGEKTDPGFNGRTPG